MHADQYAGKVGGVKSDATRKTQTQTRRTFPTLPHENPAMGRKTTTQ